MYVSTITILQLLLTYTLSSFYIVDIVYLIIRYKSILKYITQPI